MRRTRRLTGLTALLLAAPLVARAQGTGQLTGAVHDLQSGRAIANANVVVVGTTLGAQSREDGSYTILGVPAGSHEVRATRVGYAPETQTATVNADGPTRLDFTLRQVAVTLNQIVVVGYGEQRRSDLTGAVSSVTPDVERTPITSVEQTLQGTAPGVQVTTASSAPGGGISIRIRGGSSINGNNEPLYVIDGFPIENDPDNSSPTAAGRDNTAPSNPLATLNPNDIASIEILKDASATAIYGARGANGVVIITTKRGSSGPPRVSLDAYTGVQSVARRYDLLDASEFMQFANEYAIAGGNAAPYTPADIAAAGAGTDWQSLIFRNAPISNAQLSVSGGTSGANATRYALSGGAFQQNGVVVGSNFRRLSLRGNVDQAVGSRFHIGSNLLVSRVNSAMVPTDGSFNAGAGAVGAALQYLPILPVRQADGTYTLLQNDYPSALAAIGVSPSNVPNPVASAIEVNDQLADTRVLANAAGDYTIVPGLTFRASIGTDYSDRTRDTYYPRTTLQGAAVNGRAYRGTLQNTSFLNENTLNYQNTFGTAHAVQAVLGYTRQSFNATRETMGNSNFVTDATGYNDIGSGAQVGGPDVGSSRTKWTLASYLGRVNYTLLDRYLFTLTGREDGSSRFGPDRRWGFFPSAAFGWRISEEPFMRRFTDLDQLKLRVSYGKAGNPSISPYQSLMHLSTAQYAFNNNIFTGYYPGTLGNPNLGWESTKELDAGLDLGLFQDRVSFSADYYDKKTDDLLLAVSIPTQSGYSSVYQNAGSILNRGIELALTLQLLRGDQRAGDLSWSTTLNYAHNRNRVLSLGGQNYLFASSINSDIKASGTIVQVGQPIGAFYGYKTAGILRDSAEAAAYAANTKITGVTSITPGMLRFVDVNGDGVIDANDRTIIGDPNPKFTLGWQNNVSYRGFELSALFDGTFGNDVLNLNSYRAYGGSPGTNITRDRFENRWTPENPDAKYPKVNSTPGALSSDFTDQVLEDGSFFRLRTVTLAHPVPPRLLGGRGLNARAYVTAQNVFTITKYTGFNPDVSSLGVGNLNRGIDIGAYPLARTIIFGLNFNY